MEPSYLFNDAYLGISEDKIHVLRNHFETDSFGFTAVHSAEIKKGKAIKNWPILLLFGLVLVIGGLVYSKGIINSILYGQGKIYIETLVVPFCIIPFGLYSIYKSLRKETILQVKVNSKKYSFSLSQFIKTDQMESLVEHLRQKLNTFNYH